MTDPSGPGRDPVRRFVVVGGGITGLAAAFRLTRLDPSAEITVLEADGRLGGKIAASPFAGIESLDESADAFLTRVPHAMALAQELGLGDRLTSPSNARANIWWHGLHPIPEGLLLGVPTELAKLARTRLLSRRAKARAAIEPLLPRRRVGDSVGAVVRSRFGDEVHERLVDPLVGSIYAADTDHFSLAGVPQIEALVGKHRSMLVAGRRIRRAAPPVSGPIFATPTGGMAAMIDALADRVRSHGADVRTGVAVERVERSGTGCAVHLASGERIEADGVVLATPARVTAPLVAAASPDAAAQLSGFEHAGVVMVTLAVRGDQWPRTMHTYSGYLVPKPVQKWVTAVSFGSGKWGHWGAVDEAGEPGVVLRISLGRDGHDVTGESDDALLNAAITEVERHLGTTLQPFATRLTRWPAAFPQYRPGHAARVDAIERALARDLPAVLVAGASYRGIGIPACIAQANAAATKLTER